MHACMRKISITYYTEFPQFLHNPLLQSVHRYCRIVEEICHLQSMETSPQDIVYL